MASKKKQQGGIRKSEGIHFVNARPSSETERLKAQRLVRAHVGRWISDQTKDKDRDAASIPSTTSSGASAGPSTGNSTSPDNIPSALTAPRPERNILPSDPISSSSFTLVSRPSPHPTRYVTAPRRFPSSALSQRSSRQWQRSSFPPSHASDSSDSSDDAQSPESGLSTEPVAFVPWYELTRIQPQISGHFDPFGTYPTEFPPDVVNTCETYCSCPWLQREK